MIVKLKNRTFKFFLKIKVIENRLDKMKELNLLLKIGVVIFMSKNLLFMNTGVGWGGVEGWNFKTASALKKRGYNIFVIAANGKKFYRKCKAEGFNVIGTKPITKKTWLNPFAVYKLVRFLKKNEIDILFFCQSSHFKFGSIAAKIAGTNKVVYRRALANPINNRFYNRFLLKYCITHFMAISKMTRDISLKDLDDNVIDKKKIKLIYNGVKVEKFNNINNEKYIRTEYNIDDDVILMGNIGRLCRQKAQQYLIEAIPLVLDEYDNIKVLIIGKGYKKDQLNSLVEKYNLENKVIFTGFRKDIHNILNELDFMVHTAIYEGCPWVILEAMMSGLPIVSTDSTSLSEFIEDGVNGFLAEDKNPKDIAEKILKMIKNKNKKDLGNKGKEIAMKKFAFKKMIDDIENQILK